MITPAMGYQVIARRMSGKIAVDFSRVAMESVPKCIDCGICVTKCPYDLPIPQMLKAHYEMWQGHCKESQK